jgi:hypothetical protein
MNERILYKFRTIDKNLFDILVKRTLNFAHPSCLNDPFDCKVDIKKAAENAISRLSGEKKEKLENFVKKNSAFLDKIQEGTGNVGICSFSSVLEESLLWSHYANEHKGLCLTYLIPGEFIDDPLNRIIGVCPVDYGKNPLTEWFMENTPENAESDFNNFANEIASKVLLIKGKGWAYEKEVRIIR